MMIMMMFLSRDSAMSYCLRTTAGLNLLRSGH